uniref:Uncharacterized protein n=1 Tax=Leucosporidium scottii TaxID=5278 RepID=A0A0H5FRR7_9BASI|nr:hypothetical protein [Leucosporidium scottii]
MLARTSTLAIVASLAAVVVAAPWGDGEDIKVSSSRSPPSPSLADSPSLSRQQFIEVKKINDDKFKKTKFNVHDATEHDKNFNQIDAKNKDVLKAVAFRKDDDDFFYKRADIFVDSLDLREAAGFNFEFDLKNEIGLDADVDFDRFKRVRSLSARAPLPLVDLVIFLQIGDVNDFGVLHKRWDGDGEDIKFIEVKAIDEDKFKKTNFNVHDRTEHDKNFNQVEAKDKDVLNVVAFRKDDDDFDHFRGSKFGDDYY